MDWRDDSACRDADPDLFFPEGNAGPAKTQIQIAKQICLRCPVTQACLHVALATGQQGVWGGLDDDERRQLRRDGHTDGHTDGHRDGRRPAA